MQINVVQGNIAQRDDPAVVVNLFEGVTPSRGCDRRARPRPRWSDHRPHRRRRRHRQEGRAYPNLLAGTRHVTARRRGRPRQERVIRTRRCTRSTRRCSPVPALQGRRKLRDDTARRWDRWPRYPPVRTRGCRGNRAGTILIRQVQSRLRLR